MSSQDLMARYAAGTLAEHEADALEAHALECGACGADLEAAMDLRGVLLKSPDEFRPRDADPSIAASTSSRWTRHWLTSAALAATLVLAAAVGWRWSRGHDETSVLRGPEEPFALHLSWESDGSLQMSWPAQRGARTYRVHVVTASDYEISEQVRETSASFRGDIVQRLPGARVDVQAENLAGEILGKSEPAVVPMR